MRKIIYCLVFVLSVSIYSQWSEQTSGLTSSLNSVSGVTDNVAWICGNAGKVLRTNNGGVNWINATGTGIPGTLDLYNIFGIDSATAIVTGSSSSAAFVYKTTNGGVSWLQVFTQPGGFIDALWMTTPLNGVMYGDPVGARWSLWKTTNGGGTWDSTLMYLPQAASEAGWNNALYASGSNVWFGTNNSRVYYSPLTGLTGSWVTESTAQLNTYSIWFNTATNGMTGGAQLLVTTNAGTNWSNVTSPGTANVSGITGTGNFWWFTRQGTSIYISTDNGTTFTPDYTASGGNYLHIQKALTGNRIWAVRDNGGISKNDGVLGINPIVGEVPQSFSLTQNYPNPFNPTTNFKFSLPTNSVVTIKIYDITGRVVDVLANNESRPAGVYEVNFDASKLSSGVYFYTLNAGSFSDSKKMVLTK